MSNGEADEAQGGAEVNRTEIPPHVTSVGSDAASSADVPELRGWKDFIRSGDLPTPRGSPPASAPPAPAPAPAEPPRVLQPNLSTESESGAASTAATATAPASAPPPSGPESEAEPSFLHGLFRRAASTIEHTISTNEVLQGAQETLTAAFSATPTGGGTREGQTSLQMPSSTTQQGSGPHPEKTTSLRVLRINASMGAAPLCMFVGGSARDLIVITEHAIEAFGRDGSKILQANLAEMRTAAVNAEANEHERDAMTDSPGRRRSRIHSRPAEGAIAATSATYLPDTDEVVIAHADNTIHVYSLRSSQMGEYLRGSETRASAATCLATAPPSSATRIFVGCANGLLTLSKAADLADVAWIHAPEACETPLGAGSTAAPVSCVTGVLSNNPSVGIPNALVSANVAVGYDGGCVSVGSFEDPANGVSYTAHGGRVSGLISFFDGGIVVSIGDEDDRSVAVCVSGTGKCLVRRMLPYVPTSIDRITPSDVEGERDARWLCASETAFLVGGSEGEIDLFRIVPISPGKMELRLVRRVSERKGRRRTILQTIYVEAEATLYALCRSGEIRRWSLSAADAEELVTPERRLRSAPYDANRAAKVVAINGDEDGVSTRLAVGEGVIAAQRVLAMVQDDDAGLDEDGKDRVVEAFQRAQAEMQEVAEQADSELRRAKLRVARTFACAAQELPGDAFPWTHAVLVAVRRAAAAELNAVTRKHSDALAKIRGETVEKLRVILLKSLDGARGQPEKVAEIRVAANQLADIPDDAL